MASLIHSAPSVGSVVKKIMAVNPELDTKQITAIVRASIEQQGGTGNEFSSAEIINEAKALELARAALG